MREQDQWYSFRCTQSSETSRQTMRVATTNEVKTYLERQRQRLVENVSDAKASVTRAESSLSQFDEFVGSIIPTA